MGRGGGPRGQQQALRRLAAAVHILPHTLVCALQVRRMNLTLLDLRPSLNCPFIWSCTGQLRDASSERYHATTALQHRTYFIAGR